MIVGTQLTRNTSKSTWSVYLITTGTRTYVGSSTDVHRRLRQHNREIVGGARSTASGAPKWKLAVYVTGFENRSSACRWERIVKCRARGRRYRAEVLINLTRGQCPPGRRHYEVPGQLIVVVSMG